MSWMFSGSSESSPPGPTPKAFHTTSAQSWTFVILEGSTDSSEGNFAVKPTGNAGGSGLRRLGDHVGQGRLHLRHLGLGLSQLINLLLDFVEFGLDRVLLREDLRGGRVLENAVNGHGSHGKAQSSLGD